MMQEHEFVGRGFAFPMRLTSRGGVALVSGHDKIVASIKSIVSTAPGERVMRPEFGCTIWSYLFDVVDSNVACVNRIDECCECGDVEVVL